MEGYVNKEDVGFFEFRGEFGGYFECSEKLLEDLRV